MKNQTENTKNTKKDVIIAEVVGFFVVERTSKKGNTFKCIVAVDENDKEHFVCYAK